MNNLMLSFSGAELSRLRARVGAVQKEITLAKGTAARDEGRAPTSALETTWASLVEMLDLGPEPVMVTCPHCQALCMPGARRCGKCWQSLPAPAVKPESTNEAAANQDASPRAEGQRAAGGS